MAGMIPQRPKGGKFNLTQEEMDGLSYYVLSGCARQSAFLKFIRPDFIGSRATAAMQNAITQFFASKEVKDYMQAYKQTLEDLLAPKAKPSAPAPKGTIEERKAKALSKLVEYVLSEADKIGDPEEGEGVDVKTIMEFANKIGIFDQKEEVEEQPRRYLPQPCLDSCRYRLFVEENCEDECQYCRYKKYGEENGIHFKNEEMLDVPPSSGTELAEQEQSD